MDAARHRAVLTTVADVIIAAATGKSLRVAVGGTHPNEVIFADHLTRALHARGRACRLIPTTSTDTAEEGTGARKRASGPAVAVIISRAPERHERDLCRIDIGLHTPADTATARDHPDREPGRQPTGHDERQPDIVINYLDPDGPAIRRISPDLARQADRGDSG